MDPQLVSAVIGLGAFLVLFIDGMLDAFRQNPTEPPPMDGPHDTMVPVAVNVFK